MPQAREQLDLLTSTNPLTEKLGGEFWDSIPKQPGVYRFWSAGGTVLYVGKSSNLRARLFSYKNARKTSVSSKIIRLIRSTDRITFSTSESEVKALLEENRLIRTLRPEFNTANKQPETYYYIQLSRPEVHRIQIKLRMSVYDDIRQQCYGAFKGHGRVRSALGAIHRTLYLYGAVEPTIAGYPAQLTRLLTPARFTHTFDTDCSNLVALLHAFLSGASADFILLRERAEVAEEPSQFNLSRRRLDIELLTDFFQHRARLNYCVREHYQLSEPVLAQQDYDDYMIFKNNIRAMEIRY